MRLAELVLAASIAAALAAAAGTLGLEAIRSDRRLRAAAEGASARHDALALVDGLVAARAPGVSARVAADGVHLRVVRAEGRRCGGSDDAPIVRIERTVRQPVVGDSVLGPVDGGWLARAVVGVGAASCTDGSAGLRLPLDSALVADGAVPVLVTEWLVLSATSTGVGALAIRSPGAPAAQPAAGPFPSGVRLEAWRADGAPAASGEAPARLTLRWPSSDHGERVHHVWLLAVGCTRRRLRRGRRGMVLFAVLVAVGLLAVVALAAAQRADAATRTFALGRARAQASAAAAGLADSLAGAAEVVDRCVRGEVGPVPVSSPPSAALSATLERLGPARCRLRAEVAPHRLDGVPWVRQAATRDVVAAAP